MATATAKVLSIRQIAFQTKAFTLAEQRNTIGTARHIGTNEYGAHLYRVPSQTSDAVYVVTAWLIGDLTCCCTAGSYGRPCCHAGAVIHAEERRQQAMTSDEHAANVRHGWDE